VLIDQECRFYPRIIVLLDQKGRIILEIRAVYDTVPLIGDKVNVKNTTFEEKLKK